jgi:hypothetical protein
MRCLDRTWMIPASLAWLVLAGCSDDGLAPPLGTDTASTSGASTGGLTLGGSGEESPATTGSPGDSSGATGASTADPASSDGPGQTDGTGTSDTDEPPPPTMCEMAEECVLVDNCCECAAYHMNDPVPICDMKCDQSMCSSLGIPDIGLVCDAGVCGLDKRDCSGLVACDALPPDCPDGTLPEVTPDGSCWTGACISVAGCDPVPGCEHCGADQACVATISQLGTTYSCKAVPDACGDTPTCECMPPGTCEAPFDDCADGEGMIQCSCAEC